MAALLILPFSGSLHAASTWTNDSAVAQSWGVSGNWSNGVPTANTANDAANFTNNYGNHLIINLDANRALGILNLGDGGGNNTIRIDAGVAGSTLTFRSDFNNNDDLEDAQLNKTTGSATDTINAGVIVQGRLIANISSGQLIVNGAFTVGGMADPGAIDPNRFEKIGGSTMTINGNFLLNNDPGALAFLNGGTLNIAGANNIISGQTTAFSGTMNFGSDTGASTTTFTAGQGSLTISGSTVNFGRANIATGSPANVSTATVSLDVDRFSMTNGTLNLLNGNGNGTTNLLAGTGPGANIFRIDGGTVNVLAGGSTGTLNIAAGMILELSNTGRFNFGGSNKNYTFAGIGHTTGNGFSTALLSNLDTNNVATLTLGGDGVNDVFNGSINMGSSGANSRIIKIGTETLTIGGVVDNSTAKFDVQGGTLVLAKASSPTVHASSSALIVGETVANASIETARIAGTYVGQGNVPVANFQDQIHFGATVTLNGNGVLDLNGASEGFNILAGNGVVTNTGGGNSVLILGENSSTSTFNGTIINGVSLWKGGSGSLNLSGNNTYTGSTVIGRAALVLTGNGTIAGTSDIIVATSGELFLDNNATNVLDVKDSTGTQGATIGRVNDLAGITLDRGGVIVSRRSATGASLEEMGVLTIQNGTNWVRTDHAADRGTTGILANVVEMNFAGWVRGAGGFVNFTEEANSGSYFATAGAGTTADQALSRFTLDVVPGSQYLVGGAGTGANTKILVGAWGAAGNTVDNGVDRLMTVQTISGVNYIRPLLDSEYNVINSGTPAAFTNVSNLAGAGTGTQDDNFRIESRFNISALNFNIVPVPVGGVLQGHFAMNALWLQDRNHITISEQNVLHLGGYAGDALHTSVDGSGVILANTASSISGGTLDFGTREAVIRTNQSFTIQSQVTGSGGLSKTGGNSLALMGNNTYSGFTSISQGEVQLFNGLGLGATGGDVNNLATYNGTELSGSGAAIVLNNGVSVGNEELTMGYNTSLRARDGANSWDGRILVDSAFAGGLAVDQQANILAQNNGILILNGDITGASAALGGTNMNPSRYNTDNFEQRRLILGNEGNNNNNQRDGMILIRGVMSDQDGLSALGGHEKLNLIIRGYAGQLSEVNNEFNVFMDDARRINGAMDLRSGYVYVGAGYGSDTSASYSLNLAEGALAGQVQIVVTSIPAGLAVGMQVTGLSGGTTPGGEEGGGLETGVTITGIDTVNNIITLSVPLVADVNAGASATAGTPGGGRILIRQHDGGNVDRAGTISSLMLTNPGAQLNAPTIIIGENTAQISSKSIAMLGGTNTSGTVTFGAGATNLDINPMAGTPTISRGLAAASNAGVSTLTMDATNFRVGYGITGTGIAPGTTITGISGNTVTLSQPLTAATSGNYAAGFTSPAGNVATSKTSTQDNATALTTIDLPNVTGVSVGQGISGTGIPAGTTILAINGNTVTLSRPTTAVGATNTVYSIFTPSNVVQLSDVTGLEVGMGITGTGIPLGTTIVSINAGTKQVTLSTVTNAAIVPNASLTVPLAYGNYNVAISAAIGAQTVTLTNVNGLVVGTTVSGVVPNTTTQIVPAGTIITAINGNVVTLSNPLIAAVTANSTALQLQKFSHFLETRLFQAAGGTSEFNARFIDDGGFSLQNEIGAITKVGQGTSILGGSTVGASDLDGGINVHGGKLILRYGLNTNNSRVNGAGAGGSVNPYQLTLAGGEIQLENRAGSVVTESFRGTFSVRAGNSAITVESGLGGLITLQLGLDNPTPRYVQNPDNPGNPLDIILNPFNAWVEPARYAGGTLQFFISDASGGGARIDYSQYAMEGRLSGVAGYDALLPYSTAKFTQGLNTWVDFGALALDSDNIKTLVQALSQVNGGTMFKSAGFGYNQDVGAWANDVTLMAQGSESTSGVGASEAGYFTDNRIFGAASGYNTTALLPNSGGNFLGVRAIRFVANTASNSNGINLGAGTKLVLGTGWNSFDGYYTVRDGGAILISNSVGDDNQFINGGTLTSAYKSTYLTQATLRAPNDARAYTYDSRDLIVHNYNTAGGVFTIGSTIVDYTLNPLVRSFVTYDSEGFPIMGADTTATRLNLVLAGPGTTHLTANNSYTGTTFVSGGNTAPIDGTPGVYQPGTLWISSSAKLGPTPGTARADSIYLNGGRLEFANDTDRTLALAVQPTLESNRGIMLGGNGGYLKLTHASTTLTYGGIIQAEPNMQMTNLQSTQHAANIGVGDLIKEGAGRLILTNDTQLNYNTVGAPVGAWNTYYGITEIREGTLQLNINTVNSGILGSNSTTIDRTMIGTGPGGPAARLDLVINGEGKGTREWIQLNGGTLGTTTGHVDGNLDGMITVTASSVIDVAVGTLRLNANQGTFSGGTGTGGPYTITKTGTGTLMMLENNADYKGNWDIKNGRLVGANLGNPFGTGASLSLGDTNAATGGVSEVMLSSAITPTETLTGVITTTGSSTVTVDNTSGLYAGMTVINPPGYPAGTYYVLTVLDQSRIQLNANATAPTSGGTAVARRNSLLPFTYQSSQNIVVNSDGAGSQVRRLGATNHTAILNSGQNNDRYVYNGTLLINDDPNALTDDLILAYEDNVANTGLGLAVPILSTAPTFRDSYVVLNGNISGAGALKTEIVYTGSVGTSVDLQVTFELNGDNSAWTGDVTLGNTIGNVDKLHTLRFGSSQALGVNNDITMNFNNVIQLGGNNMNLGNVMVTPAGITAGTGAALTAAGIIIENASNTAAKVTINQTNNETWDILFRNGTTPAVYSAETAQVHSNTLSLQKLGAATAIMTQSNLYTGTTEIGAANGPTGGTLQAGTSNVISADSALTVYAGTFDFGTFNQTLNKELNLGAGASGTTATIASTTGVVTLGNNVNYNATNNPNGAVISALIALGAAPRTFNVGDSTAANDDLTVSGSVSGATGIIKTGLGTMVLSANNSYTGPTTVTTGRLQVGVGGGVTARAAGDTGGTNSLQVTTVNSGAFLGGTGTIQGASTTTHILNGTLQPGDFTAGVSQVGKLDFVGSLNATSGTMQFQINGNSMNDPGIVPLDPTSATYATYISTRATVTAGVQGGTYDNSVTGTLGGANHDYVNISNGLTLTGASQVSVAYAPGSAYTFAAGDIIDLLDWVNALGGSGFNAGGTPTAGGTLRTGGGAEITDLDLPLLTGNLRYDVSKFTSNGLIFVVQLVPEPSRAILVFFGLAMAIMRRRRK